MEELLGKGRIGAGEVKEGIFILFLVFRFSGEKMVKGGR